VLKGDGMISFRFDIKKIVQIVNYLLKKNGGFINYTKLVKLLYIADKEFLKNWDYTITGASYVSLDKGPILSEVYDLLKGKNEDEIKQLYWDNFFYTDGYDLRLVQDNNLPIDRLCDAEIETLEKVDTEFKDKDYGYLIDYTHNKKLFPEVKWEEAKNSSIPLPVEDILKALGRTDVEINNLKEEIELLNKESEFFSKSCS